MATICGNAKENNLFADLNSDDFLFGYQGNDFLSDWGSTSGDNYMYGGTGADLFDSVAGKDHLFGGRGDDDFFIYGDSKRWVDGGPGHDRIFIEEGSHPHLRIANVEEVVFF